MRFCAVSCLLLLCLPISIASGQAQLAPDDETITFWVGSALREDPRVWIEDVDVSTRDGIVTLTGTVESWIHQRYAAMVTRKIRGARGLVNRITVSPGTRSDEELESDIRKRLAAASGLKIDELRVVVQDGSVKLTGTVKSYGHSAEAELVAGGTNGVLAVDNQLELRPTERRSDDEIADEIVATLRRDVYLTGLQLGVKVKGGTVTLSGVVGNLYLQVRAEQLARNTSNVGRVVNQIQINWLADRGERADVPTNRQLTEHVRVQLHRDPRVTSKSIEVSAADGHVTLTGTVPTAFQKMIAALDARDVAAVIRVTNQLTVKTAAIADDLIAQRIRDGLAADTALKGHGIVVQARDGQVFLTGKVSSFYAKVQASRVASRVHGVVSLANNIDSGWKQTTSDADLRSQIQRRLKANWSTGSSDAKVAVEVRNGNVVLTGGVRTWAQRREAGRSALFTKGIRSLQNRVTVSGVEYNWDEWDEDEPNPNDWIFRYRGDFLDRPGIARG